MYERTIPTSMEVKISLATPPPKKSSLTPLPIEINNSASSEKSFFAAIGIDHVETKPL